MSRLNFITRLWPVLRNLPRTILVNGQFFGLLFTILLAKVFILISRVRILPVKLSESFLGVGNRIYALAIRFLEKSAPDTISQSSLIEMSLKNMKARRTRTMVTIGGMTIGIAAIVFLVSLGYGLQQVVTSRVARLDELRQTDLAPQPGSRVKINDKTISQIKQFKSVEKVLPLISVVGQVNYKNSVSDMAVYGVTADYLSHSAIKPSQGKIFTSNDITVAYKPVEDEGEVAGVSVFSAANTALYKRAVSFDVEPEVFARVRSGSSQGSSLIGYTKRAGGKMDGVEVLGGSYESDNGSGKFVQDANTGKWYGKWVMARVPIWEKTSCEVGAAGCVNGSYRETIDETGKQRFVDGYMAYANLQVEGNLFEETPAVLGVSSASGEVKSEAISLSGALEITLEELSKSLSATESADLGVASESAVGKVKVNQRALGEKATKVAIMNRAALKILGISESRAIGEKFSVKFIVVGSLTDNPDEKIESNPADYTIVAITPDDKTPLFFVPFMDLRSLGIVNYSQLKLVADNKNNLPQIRKQAEVMGLNSRSVADTVDQINSLFGTVRTFLAVVGMVALAVASLGMFNTLTVSLLERTREVGLMKAMGMRSTEIKNLFLTESMVMSFMGGILGLIAGSLFGKLVGVILSIFTVTRGLGVIDISYVPVTLIISIIVLSFVVGTFTGYYPSRRATKISALNALRYE